MVSVDAEIVNLPLECHSEVSAVEDLSDITPHQYPITKFYTGRMLFLTPNQQCQSTEGTPILIVNHPLSASFIYYDP